MRCFGFGCGGMYRQLYISAGSISFPKATLLHIAGRARLVGRSAGLPTFSPSEEHQGPLPVGAVDSKSAPAVILTRRYDKGHDCGFPTVPWCFRSISTMLKAVPLPVRSPAITFATGCLALICHGKSSCSYLVRNCNCGSMWSIGRSIRSHRNKPACGRCPTMPVGDSSPLIWPIPICNSCFQGNRLAVLRSTQRPRRFAARQYRLASGQFCVDRRCPRRIRRARPSIQERRARLRGQYAPTPPVDYPVPVAPDVAAPDGSLISPPAIELPAAYGPLK